MAEDHKAEEFPRFERVLVIGAHPDDPDFSAAGTLARLVEGGAKVTIVICTDGSEGGEDPAVPDAELTQLRYAEQCAAAAQLGIQDVVFLGHPDGRLENTLDRPGIVLLVRRQARPRRERVHDQQPRTDSLSLSQGRRHELLPCRLRPRVLASEHSQPLVLELVERGVHTLLGDIDDRAARDRFAEELRSAGGDRVSDRGHERALADLRLAGEQRERPAR